MLRDGFDGAVFFYFLGGFWFFIEWRDGWGGKGGKGRKMGCELHGFYVVGFFFFTCSMRKRCFQMKSEHGKVLLGDDIREVD